MIWGVIFGDLLEAFFIVFNTVLEVWGGGLLGDLSGICLVYVYFVVLFLGCIFSIKYCIKKHQAPEGVPMIIPLLAGLYNPMIRLEIRC